MASMQDILGGSPGSRQDSPYRGKNINLISVILFQLLVLALV